MLEFERGTNEAKQIIFVCSMGSKISEDGQ